MCRRVECRECGKPTFAGCGAHVEQVLADVPRAERCRCNEEQDEKDPQANLPAPRGWLRNLFSR